jgi:DNA-binding IclR family transcriptional regulator
MATDQSPRPPDDTMEASAYADNAVTRLLGTHAKAKMLTVFVGKAETDLSAREVSDLAGIHPSTFNEHVGDLLDLGVVVETRQSGNAQLYQLNPDSDVAETIRQLQFELMEAVAESNADG